MLWYFCNCFTAWQSIRASGRLHCRVRHAPFECIFFTRSKDMCHRFYKRITVLQPTFRSVVHTFCRFDHQLWNKSCPGVVGCGLDAYFALELTWITNVNVTDMELGILTPRIRTLRRRLYFYHSSCICVFSGSDDFSIRACITWVGKSTMNVSAEVHQNDQLVSTANVLFAARTVYSVFTFGPKY